MAAVRAPLNRLTVLSLTFGTEFTLSCCRLVSPHTASSQGGKKNVLRAEEVPVGAQTELRQPTQRRQCCGQLLRLDAIGYAVQLQAVQLREAAEIRKLGRYCFRGPTLQVQDQVSQPVGQAQLPAEPRHRRRLQQQRTVCGHRQAGATSVK